MKNNSEAIENLHHLVANLTQNLRPDGSMEYEQVLEVVQAVYKIELPNPRRVMMSEWTPAEKAIHAAIAEVEKMPYPGHFLQTKAVGLLVDAKNAVADYVDLNLEENAS